jgi:hypothetical protein
MDKPEFMRFPIALIPDEIIQEYNLLTLLHNGYIYVQIDKGMYGLPQAGDLFQSCVGNKVTKEVLRTFTTSRY